MLTGLVLKLRIQVSLMKKHKFKQRATAITGQKIPGMLPCEIDYASESILRLIGSRFVPSLALSILVSLASPSSGKEIEYKVVDGKLAVFGYVLEPKYPIPGDDSEGRVIAFHPSPDERWVVIQSGYRVAVDLWLYDTATRAKPVRVASEPGNHTTINWHGSKVFEVFWGGMGYSMSELFRVEHVDRGKRVDDMLLYDDRRDLYVSFLIDEAITTGIEVGRAFAEPGVQPEKFKLDLDYTYVSEARFTIENVKIVGSEIVVTHTRENMKN